LLDPRMVLPVLQHLRRKSPAFYFSTKLSGSLAVKLDDQRLDLKRIHLEGIPLKRSFLGPHISNRLVLLGSSVKMLYPICNM
ncbi:MAG: hypothetical protein ACRERE_01990, partial [Candidatus Entotheonellia bacterium]